MPRGLPDYYNPDTLVSQRLANVEEVVTAIQGIANLDNRGRTLFYEHFSEGVSGWTLSKSGDGVSPVVSVTKAEIPPASLLIEPGTLSGSGTGTALKQFRIQNIRSAGFEFSLAYFQQSIRLYGYMQYDNGTDLLSCGVRINTDTYEVEILDATGWVGVATLGATSVNENWLPLKLVVDFANVSYVRLLVGLTQYDISAYSPFLDTAVGDGRLRTYLIAVPLDNDGDLVYIGHVAITIDEP